MEVEVSFHSTTSALGKSKERLEAGISWLVDIYIHRTQSSANQKDTAYIQ